MRPQLSQENLRPPDRGRLVPTWELLRALVVKELKVKYKRSVLGFFWSLLTPLALAGIYVFVFVYVYKVPKPNFIVFLLSGLLPWNFFNMSILAATPTLVENGPLIRKVFFPRYLLPSATVLSNLINFSIGLIFFCVFIMFADGGLLSTFHYVVLAVALETLLCLGLAMGLSIINVYLRDVQQLISILTLVLFFATPIVYDLSQVPEGFLPLILANPMSAIIELYRAGLYGAAPPSIPLLALGIAEVAAVFGAGALLFRRLSPNLAKEV